MGARPPDEKPAPFPERVGRYELLLPIASGGMATVYLARTTSVGRFEREVALKLIHAHLRSDPQFPTALMDEAAIAGRIRHPNVVSVLDVDDDPHGVFLVMDYVEGASLAALVRRAHHSKAALPPDIALRIADDVLSGLHAAHELRDSDGSLIGIVHRDVTPQNVLVGIDGVTRLTDFGVAKAATRLTNTNTGVIKGKVAYMSPEQARGKPVDRTCDVWAAGVIVWELLAGTRLYETTNVPSTLLRVVSDAPPRLRSVRPDLPEHLDEVVRRALAMRVKDRYQTAEAFARELSAAADESFGRAEHREVGTLVKNAVGNTLARRKEQVAKVLELRRQLGRVAAPSFAGALTPSTTRAGALPPAPAGETPAAEHGSGGHGTTQPTPGGLATADAVQTVETTRTETISVSTGAEGPRRRRTPRAVLLRGAVATGVAAAVGVAALVTSAPTLAPRDDRRGSGTATNVPIAIETASAAGPLRAAPSAPAPIAAVDVELEADAPIVSVVVGRRLIEFDERRTRQTVRVEANERRASVVAISQDGRTAQGSLTADAGSVVLTFGKPADDAERRRPQGRMPTPRDPTKPPRRLLANPYRRKR